MQTHYVMNEQSQMVVRDSLQGCRRWIELRHGAERSHGLPIRKYRIFYHAATVPCEIHGTIDNGPMGALSLTYKPMNP